MASYRVLKINGVSISMGNAKLGAIPTVSMSPALSCLYNGTRDCLRRCYARRLACYRKVVDRAWTENARIWQTSPVRYFNAVRSVLRSASPERFRWHVAGDIPNKAYLKSMIAIAQEFPRTRFLVHTKSYNLLGVRGLSVPTNLTIRVSAWPGPRWKKYQKKMTDGRYPVSWTSHLGETDPAYNIPAGAAVCPGSCEKCSACWSSKVLNLQFKAH